ncbi:MAG: Dolichyl-phosphate-mannose-protein mannosyltransferase [Phycisphaerales bacterium]|jgi:hypothetical protein|nr:Dolichyl-phosphate-mannose-protein mannosyltransferase [Phycisphaerales bacterium]
MTRGARRIILLLSVLGALRVLAFSAAYPFFNYIDESLHLDTVLDFVRVGLPGPGDDVFNADAARVIATGGSGRLAPPYVAPHDLLPPAERERAIAAETQRLMKYRNAETFAPPVYYALAATWYRLGQAIGLRDTGLLYWLRFLAAPMYGAAIWVGCRICLDFHSKRPELAVGVGILLAALPQDIFYSINSDVLSPLAVAVALYLLVRWVEARKSAVGLAACAGLAVSMAMLVKYTNVGLLPVVPVAILIALRRDRGLRSGREIAALLLAAAIPLAAWMLRCQLVFGDWSGTRDKAAMLDWTVLPLSQSLKHPIFGPLGVMEFISRLCITFWRGELIWNNETQRLRGVDIFYLCTSAVGLLGTAGWLLRPSARARAERPLALIYFTAVAASVIFLGLISTRFDYGHCFFPSRGFPYFAAGRLMSGAIVPFAILLIGGFDELVPHKGKVSPGILFASVIATVCLASEIYLCSSVPAGRTEMRSVFESPGNAYHLFRPGSS